MAGSDIAASALVEVSVLDVAWDFYFDRYVGQGWQEGFAPEDLFGGFGELVAARQGELDRLRQQRPETHPSRWDTHPPLADRISAVTDAGHLVAVHRGHAYRRTTA